MARPFIKTMPELLHYYYGAHAVAKADAPVLTTTTGVSNPVFGAMAFSQLNAEANVFAALPKFPMPHTGFRVITADAGSTAGGGVAENAAVPDTIKPTFAEVTTTVKEIAHAFDVSFRHEGLIKKTADDNIGDMDLLRPYFADLHAKRMNEMLLVDGDTLAGDNFESIDRVTASSAYATAVSWTAGDEDIYNIDRSAASWSDAVVSHNSGTDRFFDDKFIRDTRSTISANGGRTNLIVTGQDTYWKMVGYYGNSVRYEGIMAHAQRFNVGLNGVETAEGANFGVALSTLYGIPVFTSQAVASDTISRIYLLDTSPQSGTGLPRLGIAMLHPTLYMESGMSAARPDPFAINRFGTEGVYYTAGELWCTFFKAQGSIRDLK